MNPYYRMLCQKLSEMNLSKEDRGTLNVILQKDHRALPFGYADKNMIDRFVIRYDLRL